MIWKLSDRVWFGDKPSPVEAIPLGVKAIVCVAHSLRRPYWEDLGRLPWNVWYFRMAMPDLQAPDEGYIEALEEVISRCGNAGKLPILCHCRAGGHRGPTAAVFAEWVLSGRVKQVLFDALRRAGELRPSYAKDNENRVYKSRMVRWCRQHSSIRYPYPIEQKT